MLEQKAPKVGKNGKLPPQKKPGQLNKTTRQAKEAIEFACEKIGGAERLAEWVKNDPDNERVFWSVIYPKLLPVQLKLQGDKENPLRMVIGWMSSES